MHLTLHYYISFATKVLAYLTPETDLMNSMEPSLVATSGDTRLNEMPTSSPETEYFHHKLTLQPITSSKSITQFLQNTWATFLGRF